ncbi:ABC transporter ATP-binding protein [Alcaligenaceae bacterium CGII-47]|nr:ABC transporter ATP-binding protein [Alcaligenaceae bacterium CGII-47]
MADMITLDGVGKIYPGAGAPALAGLSLNIQEGEFFTLLGPSGCGKTTLLRCIAGLEMPSSGMIRIGSTTVFDFDQQINLGPNYRNIGMVFQSYAIWPHMTVFENVAFPLRCRKEKNVRQRVERAMNVVGLQDFAERYSSRLSGGQQQRVALARAIVAQPDVMLLDEPLSNLDATLRTQMRAELRRLQKEIGVTTVLVTHDQQEALSMSDRIAVMSDGRVLEVDTPRNLYQWPKTAFSAQFIGSANLLPGMLTDRGLGPVVTTAIGELKVIEQQIRGEVTCFIRPEHIRITAECAQNEPNVLPASLGDIQYIGENCECDVLLPTGGQQVSLRARISADTMLRQGDRCHISIPPEQIRCIEVASQNRTI